MTKIPIVTSFPELLATDWMYDVLPYNLREGSLLSEYEQYVLGAACAHSYPIEHSPNDFALSKILFTFACSESVVLRFPVTDFRKNRMWGEVLEFEIPIHLQPLERFEIRLRGFEQGDGWVNPGSWSVVLRVLRRKQKSGW